MRYFSICSGIEAASVAWEPLGWKAVGFSEIEPFPSAVLKHRFPNTPNYGDATQHATWPIEPGSIDLLVFGSPCQSFSVAGLRKGLADPRGNLALVILGFADRIKPKWIIWENVPGVLSSNGGKDFGSFLGALGELGYGFAYRVLDAQNFGVPQRRRRVFVVACLGAGGWESAAKVLFEPESLRRDTPKGGSKGKSNPSHVEDDLGEGVYENRPTDSRITGPHKVAPTMTSRFGTGGGNIPIVHHKLNDENDFVITFQPGNLRRDAGAEPSTVSTTTLKASPGDQMPHIATSMVVRKLTPTECLRLQGFQDGWTRIPWNGKSAEKCPDGPQYKAAGNSMAVPCMSWLGKRIQMVEGLAR
jgi:DNA (cytosine-5)-methyltransferase 1